MVVFASKNGGKNIGIFKAKMVANGGKNGGIKISKNI